MEQLIITAHSAGELNKKIREMMAEGWKPVGSHQVIQTHIQNRYSGMQHKDSIIEVEYSQTMSKEQ